MPVEQRIACTGSECEACGAQRAACTLDVRSEEAEQSKRSDHNFKVEEIEEDTRNVSYDSRARYLSILISGLYRAAYCRTIQFGLSGHLRMFDLCAPCTMTSERQRRYDETRREVVESA